MTRDELLKAIDEEIEWLYVDYHSIDSDSGYSRELRLMNHARTKALQWVRDLIEEPPGAL